MSELICPRCATKAEWSLSYWSTITCTNDSCGFFIRLITEGMTNAQALEAITRRWNTIVEAVTIEATETGGFFVMFGNEAVGFHLSRPNAERNQHRFLIALSKFVEQLEEHPA